MYSVLPLRKQLHITTWIKQLAIKLYRVIQRSVIAQAVVVQGLVKLIPAALRYILILQRKITGILHFPQKLRFLTFAVKQHIIVVFSDFIRAFARFFRYARKTSNEIALTKDLIADVSQVMLLMIIDRNEDHTITTQQITSKQQA